MELIQEIFRRLMKLFGNQGLIFGEFRLNILIKSESSDEISYGKHFASGLL